MGWDAGFLIYLQDHFRSDALTPVMTFITHTGDSGILFIAVSLILLIIPASRRVGIVTTISLAIEALLNNVLLKNIIARTRPYDAIEGLENIIERQSDYSFPSGHTGIAFALTGVLLIIALWGLPKHNGLGEFSRSKMGTAFRVVAVLTIIYSAILGFSRLYVGVHYPTDVIGGMILGFITSAIAYLIYHAVIKRNARKAADKEETVTE